MPRTRRTHIDIKPAHYGKWHCSVCCGSADGKLSSPDLLSQSITFSPDTAIGRPGDTSFTLGSCRKRFFTPANGFYPQHFGPAPPRSDTGISAGWACPVIVWNGQWVARTWLKTRKDPISFILR